jgi:Leucine-rich repeat (LRR) protein
MVANRYWNDEMALFEKFEMPGIDKTGKPYARVLVLENDHVVPSNVEDIFVATFEHRPGNIYVKGDWLRNWFVNKYIDDDRNAPFDAPYIKEIDKALERGSFDGKESTIAVITDLGSRSEGTSPGKNIILPDTTIIPKFFDSWHGSDWACQASKESVTKKGTLKISDAREIPRCIEKYGPSLRKLQVNGNWQMETTENLDKLTGLEELEIYGAKITSMEGIQFLKNLKKLDLHGNEIDAIDWLDGLDKIEELNLNTNNIRRIENIDGLERLALLDLARNEISKLQNLDHNKNLKTLVVGGKENKERCLKKIEHIDHLSKLHVLDVSDNNIEWIEQEPIANLEQLEVLRAKNNHLTNIEDINNPNLVEIDISKNWLESIIGSLPPSLRKLDVSDNKMLTMNDMKPVLRLDKLESLDVSDNTRLSTDRMEYRHLHISANDFRPLVAMKEFAARDLKMTGLPDFARNDIFPNIKKIDISNNSITDIYSSDSLATIEELDASGNSVRMFKGDWPSLKVLKLNKNGIKDMSDWSFILPKTVTRLELNKNPVCEHKRSPWITTARINGVTIPCKSKK